MSRPFSHPRQSLPRASEKGTVLIVALLICSVIGISLGSYLALSKSSLKLANRTFYNTSAINLAETGVEEALWCFNQATAGVAVGTAWNYWTTSGNLAKRTFTDFTLSGGATVEVRVLVQDYNPVGTVQPKIVSEATVTIPSESRTLKKVVAVDLRRRSLFAMGLVAKNEIIFNGNTCQVDSWNSQYKDDGTVRASPVPYSAAVQHASGSVGSTSVVVGTVGLKNADLFGFASVGGTTTAGVMVGSGGIVSGNLLATPGTFDTTRVATDFTANFDDVTNPTVGTDIASVGATLGTTGATTTYRFAGVINSDLTIEGKVTLILTGAGDVIKLNGGGDVLTLAPNATLTIYTAGDIDLTGGGVANPSSQASTLQIYASGSMSQKVEVGGGAEFTGVVYAPNAHVKIHGNPHVMGSIVANTITVVGTAKFHYDEALGNFGGNNPFGIVKWMEITDQTARTTAFSAWW